MTDFIVNILIALGVMTALGALLGCLCGMIGVKKKKSHSVKKEIFDENPGMRAFVKCAGGNISERRYTLSDIEDCSVADSLYGGMTECRYACLGLGNCVRACEINAISIQNGVAKIDESICDGCGVCVDVCPRSVIAMIPETATVTVACASTASGVELSELCDIGCIGCGTCVNTCEYDAISIENNMAEINYEKCMLCAACAGVCPRGIILAPLKEENEEIKLDEFFENIEAIEPLEEVEDIAHEEVPEISVTDEEVEQLKLTEE